MTETYRGWKELEIKFKLSQQEIRKRMKAKGIEFPGHFENRQPALTEDEAIKIFKQIR